MTVRVGFLGAGLIATYHSKSLRASGEDLAWAAVYDPDRLRAERFGTETGAPVCSSEPEVLDACDAVYVCTWTSEHRRLVEAAAERGLAVFCEKPLSTDLEGARAMTEAVQRAGLVNQVGLVLRSSPSFLLARSLVREQAAGRVMSVVFRDDQYIPTQGMYESVWQGDVAKAGAGTLLEHAIHDIDLLEWMLGPIVSASARSAAFHAIPGIEDVMVVSFEFESGAIASLTSVWHDVLARPSFRRVEVFCEHMWCAVEGDWWGPVRWTNPEGDGAMEGATLAAAALALDPAGGNPDAAFMRAVREGRPAQPDFAVALRAHVVADAVYRSAARGGQPMEVP